MTVLKYLYCCMLMDNKSVHNKFKKIRIDFKNYKSSNLIIWISIFYTVLNGSTNGTTISTRDPSYILQMLFTELLTSLSQMMGWYFKIDRGVCFPHLH
jgi:hypothetical protein